MHAGTDNYGGSPGLAPPRRWPTSPEDDHASIVDSVAPHTMTFFHLTRRGRDHLELLLDDHVQISRVALKVTAALARKVALKSEIVMFSWRP